MLAVRKLLLADDSITIQKIVALTFADQGIEVIAVDNGTEAVAYLRENSPDVVLADVFMPGLTGYEVCEHVKQTESLKHIPVMLLVGSFEPFDEVEARRVGADDILTKPFQSIRTLMDKVGALLGRAPSAGHPEEVSAPVDVAPVVADVAPPEIEMSQSQQLEETPSDICAKDADTRELPPPPVIPPPEEPMTSEELEITTADTQPLSPEIKERLEHLESVGAEETVLEKTMQTNLPVDTPGELRHERVESFADGLLDLSHYEHAGFVEGEDVILDIDFDSSPSDFSAPASFGTEVGTEVAVGAAVEAPVFVHAVSSPAFADNFPYAEQREEAVEVDEISEPAFVEPPAVALEAMPVAVESEAMAATLSDIVVEPEQGIQPETVVAEPRAVSGEAASQTLITLEQLSPEVIDAIARRVVEQMSDKAVQEIAWEVVPQLADLMIKRQLEERETQNR